MEITLKVELSQETKDFFTQLLQPNQPATIDLEVDLKETLEKLDEAQEDLQKEQPVLVSEETYTEKDLKVLAVSIAKKHDSNTIKEFLNEQGFNRISDIPASRVTEMYLKLEELDGQA